MRLTLYWRGRDVIDVEVHAWKKRADDGSEPPKMEAVGYLADSSRAEPTDEPDTRVFGFGVVTRRDGMGA